MWTKRQILVAAVVVVVVLTLLIALCVGIFYNLQNLRGRNITATQAARQAVEAHDLETFKKYVDVDKLVDQAATQILTEQINSTIDPQSYSTDAIQTRYENQLKPDFVQSAQAALEEYVSTGKVTYPATLTEAQKFLKETGAASCELKSISKPRLEGHTQYSTAIFYNPYLKFSFELELELTDSAEVGWRITSAKGFEDYYKGYRRSLRHKLDSLNMPIGHKMDEIFHVKSFSVESAGGDEYGISKTLNIAIKADVKSDKPLSKIVGNVILSGKGEHESIAPFTIDMTDRKQGVQVFNVKKTLNPFVRNDADAMKHGLRVKDIHIEVTEIIFEDGTNLKLLDRLPE